MPAVKAWSLDGQEVLTCEERDGDVRIGAWQRHENEPKGKFDFAAFFGAMLFLSAIWLFLGWLIVKAIEAL